MKDNATAKAVRAWAPPESFEGFRVIRALGRGGMGHVYLGQDTVLDRPVALKFINADNPDPLARDRFLREARALARLRHPNIVAIYRIGEINEQPFIAYEFIEGHTLAMLRQATPWRKVLQIALGIARGLAAVHRRGILHRDIKPANVMLTNEGEVRLIDFGLAKLAGDEDLTVDGEGFGGDGTHELYSPSALSPESPGEEPLSPVLLGESQDELTRPGTLLGTPSYLAPEIRSGEGASPQSDIYSLGLMLYEILSGPVIDTSDTQDADVVSAPTKPSLRSVCPDVPDSLAMVVDRCLMSRPERRFANGGELAEALEAVRSFYQALDHHGGGNVELEGEDPDAALVTQSFARLSAYGDAWVSQFYEHLFLRHSELRALFPEDLIPQRQKLAVAMQLSIENLAKPDRLIPLLENLGARHASYGVRPQHFDMLGESLIWALSRFDSSHWSDELEAAWSRAYNDIADAMKRGLLGALQSVTREPSSQWPGSGPRLLRSPADNRYAHTDDLSIAYQEIGEGPVDLIIVPGFVSHLDVGWSLPAYAAFLRHLGGCARVLLLDKRGTGLSDRVGADAAPEVRMHDIAAVQEAAGAERPILFGISDGGALCALYAERYPDRVSGLILYGTRALGSQDPDPEHGERMEKAAERVRNGWGQPLFLDEVAPSMADNDQFARWWADMLRLGASPGAAVAILRGYARLDVREAAAGIQTPTLVLQRSADPAVPVECGRRLAEIIPNARLVELPGRDHLPYLGEQQQLVDAIESFLVSRRGGGSPHTGMGSPALAAHDEPTQD